MILNRTPEQNRAWIVTWAESEDGKAFPDHASDLLAHDPSCASLEWVWLPRRGGRTCIGDLGKCRDCGLAVYWEGLTGAWEDGHPDLNDDEGILLDLCTCCGDRRRGGHPLGG